MVRKISGTYNSRARQHLIRHIERYWPSQAEFARTAGVKIQHLNQIAKGALRPGLKYAVEIERVSADKGDPILPREWMDESGGTS